MLKLIRKNNQDHVTAYEDAIIFHQAKGHDVRGGKRGGVFNGVYNGFRAITDNINKKVIIQSGVGMLFGRQFELPGNETHEIDLSGVNVQRYYTVYVEVNTSVDPETVAIKTVFSPTAYPSVASDDIYRNESGVATMPLYNFMVTSSLVITVPTAIFYSYIPGRAQEAESIPATGRINSRLVSDLVFSDRDAVKVASRGDYAQIGRSIGTRGNKNAVANDLRLTQRNTYLTQSKRLANIEITPFSLPNQQYTAAIEMPTLGTIDYYVLSFVSEQQTGTPPVINAWTHMGAVSPVIAEGRRAYLITLGTIQGSPYGVQGGIVYNAPNLASNYLISVRIEGNTLIVQAGDVRVRGRLKIDAVVTGGA